MKHKQLRVKKGYKGERAGTAREKARMVMDQAVKKGLERPKVIAIACQRARIKPSTAANWCSRWHGEHRA